MSTTPLSGDRTTAIPFPTRFSALEAIPETGNTVIVTIGESTRAKPAHFVAPLLDPGVVLGTFGDEEAELLRSIEALERLAAQQREAQSDSDQTVWHPSVQTMSSSALISITPVSLGGRRNIKQRRDARRQARLDELRSKLLALALDIDSTRRTPTQRMFDAIRRHDHDALRRALAAGATVQDRFVTDDPRDASMRNSTDTTHSFQGYGPVHYALLEDDPMAFLILQEADDGTVAIATRYDDYLWFAHCVARYKNVQCPKVVAMLETLVLRKTLRDTIDEPSAPTRTRARL